jgi:Flp pilus assembly pilin Flp/alpha-tubulin suppressor-like RCC1 family protein
VDSWDLSAEATMGQPRKTIRRDERGATAIEYALIAACVAVASVASVTNLGDVLDCLYNGVAASIKTGARFSMSTCSATGGGGSQPSAGQPSISAFTALTNQNTSATVTSSSATISGLTDDATLTVSGPNGANATCSVDGGASSSSVSVVAGPHTVVCQATTSNQENTDETVTVQLTAAAGDWTTVSATWDVKTAQQSGNLYAWGNNWNYSISQTASSQVNTPVAVGPTAGMSIKWMQIPVYPYQVTYIAQKSDNTAVCWGNQQWGGCGNGVTSGSVDWTGWTAVTAAGGMAFAPYSIWAGPQGVVAGVTSGGAAYTWGGVGVSASGFNSSTPRAQAGSWSSLIPGRYNWDMSACGVQTNGELSCIGDNNWSDGSLGVNLSGIQSTFSPTNANSYFPGNVAVQAANGPNPLTAWLDSGAAVHVWGGNNSYGQHGDGTTTGNQIGNTTFQIPVAAAQVVIAGSTTAVLGTDGTVWTAGNNQFGQLGLGTTDNNPHPTPTRVPGLSGVVKLYTNSSAGWIAALFADGTGVCWGTDGYNCGTSPTPLPSPPNGGKWLGIYGTGGGNGGSTMYGISSQ